MRKFILAVLLVVGLAGLTYAAVALETNGTKVKKTEVLNFVGPTLTAVSGEVTIDTTKATSLDVAGTVEIDGTIYAGNLAGNKRVVCVGVNGFLYASSTTVDCP